MSGVRVAARQLRPPALYVIVDAEVLGLERIVAAAREAIRMGVEWLQVRAKRADDRALYEIADGVAGAAAGGMTRVWLNDRADLAALLPVAGVHLGQDDLPPAAARRILRPGQWIGRSTHTREQVAQAAEDPDVDLIAVGPVFTTTSKKRPEPTVGLDLVSWARLRTDKPIVAIGGLDSSDFASVFAAGADSVAVLGAVCHGNVAENCRLLGAAAIGARSSGGAIA